MRISRTGHPEKCSDMYSSVEEGRRPYRHDPGKWIRLAILILAAGMAARGSADPLPGSFVPPASLVTRSGAPTTWHPGRATVISFFAFWCDTWKDQSPRLRQAMGALQGLPIDLLTISVDGRWDDVPGFDPSQPCLLDRIGWSSRLGVDRVPSTIVVDGQGRIRWVKSGVTRSDDIVREARSALGAAKSGSVTLRFEDFPPPNGGFELLDELRRLGVHVTLGLRPGVSRDDPTVRKAIEMGNEIADGPVPPNTVDPFDTTRPGAAEIVRRVVLGARPGSTVLLHAGVGQTLDALPRIVDALRSRGLAVR